MPLNISSIDQTLELFLSNKITSSSLNFVTAKFQESALQHSIQDLRLYFHCSEYKLFRATMLQPEETITSKRIQKMMMTNNLINWPINSLVNRLINSLVNRLINSLVNRLINSLVNRLINSLVNRLIIPREHCSSSQCKGVRKTCWFCVVNHFSFEQEYQGLVSGILKTVNINIGIGNTENS